MPLVNVRFHVQSNTGQSVDESQAIEYTDTAEIKKLCRDVAYDFAKKYVTAWD